MCTVPALVQAVRGNLRGTRVSVGKVSACLARGKGAAYGQVCLGAGAGGLGALDARGPGPRLLLLIRLAALLPGIVAACSGARGRSCSLRGWIFTWPDYYDDGGAAGPTSQPPARRRAAIFSRGALPPPFSVAPFEGARASTTLRKEKQQQRANSENQYESAGWGTTKRKTVATKGKALRK